MGRLGRVEFEGDITLLQPVDGARANGRLLTDVVNRGNHTFTRYQYAPANPANRGSIPSGDAWLLDAGWTIACIGWQWDVARGRAQLGLDAPSALGEDGKLYNAIVALQKGEIVGRRYKVDLPNYGVFDDKRGFSPGPMPGPLLFEGVRIGVPICEDMWTPEVVECVAELVEATTRRCVDRNDLCRLEERAAHAVRDVHARELGPLVVDETDLGQRDHAVRDAATDTTRHN